MRCPRCQHDNPGEAKFCQECGNRLAMACPACGEKLPAGAKFCSKCGAPVVAGAAFRPSAPDSYTPRHLAERVLRSKAALEGERKLITVLFADLKGSMELFADRDPEEARKVLDPVLELMMEAVHRYEGTVNQVMGDGIMALFGAPLTHEDHAVRACYAALRMQESVKRYAEEVHRTLGVPVHIRVGVNSGEVIVRSIGSDLRMDYTAVGQTTNVAARLEQVAMPGSILISPETLKLGEGFVLVKPLGVRPVKGLVVPLELFEVVGVGAVRSRLQAAAARGLTRFVGRGTELDQLQDALDRTDAGHGQVVAVVGEPGVGKSRLFWEFTHSDGMRRRLVLQAASFSYGKASTYFPVIGLLRGYFGIESRDDPRAIREKVASKVVSLTPALGPAVPAFLALLDVPVDDVSWQSLDPMQWRQRTLDALKRLLLRESEVQPLVLVFEDLHWIDGETQALLDNLVDSLPAARLLLLVNYRPEYQHAWGGKTYYRQLRIDPLRPESADELLDELLGADPSLRPLKRLLIEQTEANPLFLEESVRTLAETGALAGERGAYQLTRPIEHLEIPGTVQAILAARIDRLEPETKRLLQAASVIGKDVPMPLLLAIADAPEHEVRAELGQLQAAEFLYETRLFPELEYTFKHALTYETAYQGLLHDRRRALHARITEAIERISTDRIAEQSERLAHHALGGELWEKAVGYLRQAGLRARGRAANREAAAHLEQALEAIRRLPDTPETAELTIDLRIDLLNALRPLGERKRMGELLQTAESLARTLGDQRRLARIATFTANQCLFTGDYERAVQCGREALGIARSLRDVSVEVVTTNFLGQAHAVRGEFGDAIALFERNVAIDASLRSERFGTDFIPSVLSGARLAEVLSDLGRFGEAIAQAEAAVKIAEPADHPYTLHFGLCALGIAHLRRGDLPSATRVLERCLDLCRTWQIVVGMPHVAGALGAAYALSGRADEAVPLVAGAVEEFRRRQSHVRPAFVLLCAGMSCVWANQLDAAAGHAREALALARRLRARGSEAHSLCLTADIALASGAEDARGYYHEALALADELGMRPLVGHCHLGLGKLCRRAGKTEQAKEHLATAAAMYREMDMRFWLEKVLVLQPD